jgi:hypothetical protein
MKLLKLKNVTGVVFHLNIKQITSFAMATKADGDDKKGCSWVAAGSQQYNLDVPSTEKLKALLELEEEDAEPTPPVLATVKPITPLSIV